MEHVYRSMLEEYTAGQGMEVKLVELSQDQDTAMQHFLSGNNLLLLGAAGTGKSKLVHEMKYQATEQLHKRIAVTATTGIAAYNINGLTIHSFMGIGTGEQPIDQLIRRVRKKHNVKKRLMNIDILVIDEISMMSGLLFEKLDVICQTIRRCTLPFGGIQLVLTGDFLQLLPVFKPNERFNKDMDTRLLFESDIFKRYFTDKNTVLLTTNHRQQQKYFMDLLMNIRTGQCTKHDYTTLTERLVKDIQPGMIHLVTSNQHANTINQHNLQEINDEAFVYDATFSSCGDPANALDLLNELRLQFQQKGLFQLTLKKGARVMLTKNLDVEGGLVNGSVGTIIGYTSERFPIVLFDIGIRQTIEPAEWTLEFGDDKAVVSQLPLLLCWAVTIHKSQSLTLDSAMMDLGSCFCEHQVYVALSRVKHLDGVFLASFDPAKIKVNQKVITFYSELQK